MRRLAAAAALGAGAAASQDGFVGLFQAACPPGWSAYAPLQGRLLLLVNNSYQAGEPFGFALSDGEDRAHAHVLSGSFSFPSKRVAALGGLNEDGAKSGAQPPLGFLNSTGAAPSGFPLAQLTACRFSALSLQPPPALPAGGVALWDAAAQAGGCPAGASAPLTTGDGRLLALSAARGWAAGAAPPLEPGRDVPHAHAFAASISLETTDYAGIAGCCDDDPTSDGEKSAAGATAAASAGLPYLAVLACNTTAGGALAAPRGFVFLSVSGDPCPAGWAPLGADLAGRFPVGTPPFGVPSKVFGGAPLAGLDAGWVPAHTHSFELRVQTGGAGVALDTGCCAHGYGKSGTYTAAGETDAAVSAAPPYIVVGACVAV